MAWIKCEHGLFEKAEVLAIGVALNIPENQAVGCCLKLWAWADRESTDGHIAWATPSSVDRIAGVEGFAAAMAAVEWLTEEDGGVRFGNWDRHNSRSAKERALSQKRNEAHRDRNAPVTRPLGARAKRRGDNIPPYIPPKGEENKATHEENKAWCEREWGHKRITPDDQPDA